MSISSDFLLSAQALQQNNKQVEATYT